MTLRVSEIYPSVQGEGPNVGAPTVFVRFGGCNLRCPGWPCDTPHAIFPDQFRKEWKKHTPQEVLDKVVELGPKNVCLTGGEPMLQSSADVVTLVNGLDTAGYSVEMFSNGTLDYPDELLEVCDVVMDWKLPGSGEAGVGINQRMDNVRKMKKHAWKHSVKFTIANHGDFNHAVGLWHDYVASAGHKLETYAGIVWGQSMTNEELVDLILTHRLPWRLNVQVHNHIWDREKRGI